MDHTSTSVSNDIKEKTFSGVEHEAPPVDQDGQKPRNSTAIEGLSATPTLPKEVMEALCNNPYDVAWMNNIDDRFLKPFKRRKQMTCSNGWSVLFRYGVLKVHDELAVKGPAIHGLWPGYQVEHYARITGIGLHWAPDIVLLNDSEGNEVTESARYSSFTDLVDRMQRHFGDILSVKDHRYNCKAISARRDGRELGTLYEIRFNFNLWKLLRKSV
ncbi:MAG: hypothetical protein Q9184_008007, partial [Pyrenodesmia sp. 2 TL-2023]